MQKLAGSNTSVYAGAYTQDYRENLQSDSLHMPRSMVTTAHSSMLAARLSHFFDLRGTSMTIDTACSTSTVGLHLACQSLRSGESDCAIVAGSSMHLRPESFINISVTGYALSFNLFPAVSIHSLPRHKSLKQIIKLKNAY